MHDSVKYTTTASQNETRHSRRAIAKVKSLGMWQSLV